MSGLFFKGEVDTLIGSQLIFNPKPTPPPFKHLLFNTNAQSTKLEFAFITSSKMIRCQEIFLRPKKDRDESRKQERIHPLPEPRAGTGGGVVKLEDQEEEEVWVKDATVRRRGRRTRTIAIDERQRSRSRARLTTYEEPETTIPDPPPPVPAKQEICEAPDEVTAEEWEWKDPFDFSEMRAILEDMEQQDLEEQEVEDILCLEGE